MSLRNIKLVDEEYYHIYNRGNGKNKIFLDKEDYDRFVKLLYISNSTNPFNFRKSIIREKINAYDFERGDLLVNIFGWVLMPNHFHLMLISPRTVLGEEEDLNNITRFMKKVCTSYAMYFNKKYKRSGGLFEGKFKAKHIGKENYFNYLFAYMHLNPIKLIQKDWKEKGILNRDGALNFLQDYKYSSFLDFFDKNKGYDRRESKIISKKLLPKYILKMHREDLFEWIKIKDE